MKFKSIILFLLIFSQISFASFNKNQDSADVESAKRIIDLSAGAMGGWDLINRIKNLQIHSRGHYFMLEQSERPEGPWFTVYQDKTEVRDLEREQVRQTVSTQSPEFSDDQTSINVYSNGVAAAKNNQEFSPLSLNDVQAFEETSALSPERLLTTALAAQDLRLEKDVILQGVKHQVVGFTWNKIPVKIFFNSNTNLPTAVETTRAYPYDVYWSVWGDINSRIYYSFWTMEQKGLRYPRQIDVVRNNQTYSSSRILSLDFNVDLGAVDFKIPESVQKSFSQTQQQTIYDWDLGLPNRPIEEIDPGYVFIRGRWNVSLIKQEDGIVVLEAPISSNYTKKVIAEANRRFPNVPIKAVVSTADSWPHFAGLREYAARGIPIYILDLNKPLVEKLLKSEYRTFPDSFAQKPRQPKINVIREKTVLGTGDNKLEIFPVRSETGERMLMSYAPKYQLLYGSDLILSAVPGTFFMPEYLTELMQAVEREKIKVKTVYAMHSPIREWNTITNYIEQLKTKEKVNQYGN